jgi:hypothetical protein
MHRAPTFVVAYIIWGAFEARDPVCCDFVHIATASYPSDVGTTPPWITCVDALCAAVQQRRKVAMPTPSAKVQLSCYLQHLMCLAEKSRSTTQPCH